MRYKCRVILIPWDYESAAHRAVLLKQREDCGWHNEKVEKEWREVQAKGDKCLYWIVLLSDDSHMTEEMKCHLRFKASERLRDTARSINGAPRWASQQVFIPVGHISVDRLNAETKHVNLNIPSIGVFWIKTFYVSHSVQSQGIGRAAMDEAEKMIIREPFNARVLMLDTIQRDDNLREEFVKAAYGSLPKILSQDWYARRGYRVIRTVQNFYTILDRSGKSWDTKTVFMRKDIA
ncbi:hypothetical protein N7507_006817 [Penicillium longicatenatum]|nr:hypothetical protein N7507_006817 [Penicillium longicatenatum]